MSCWLDLQQVRGQNFLPRLQTLKCCAFDSLISSWFSKKNHQVWWPTRAKRKSTWPVWSSPVRRPPKKTAVVCSGSCPPIKPPGSSSRFSWWCSVVLWRIQNGATCQWNVKNITSRTWIEWPTINYDQMTPELTWFYDIFWFAHDFSTFL